MIGGDGMTKVDDSVLFLLGEPVGDVEANLVVVEAVVELVLVGHLPHLAGDAAPPEVHEYHHSIHPQDQARAEYHYQVRLRSSPRSLVHPQKHEVRQRLVADPHVGDVEGEGEDDDAEDEAARPEAGVGGQLEGDHQDDGGVAA